MRAVRAFCSGVLGCWGRRELSSWPAVPVMVPWPLQPVINMEEVMDTIQQGSTPEQTNTSANRLLERKRQAFFGMLHVILIELL